MSRTLIWSLLVFLIPLACNPLTRWGFEPDKAALLLLLAGLLAGRGVALPRRGVMLPLALYTLLMALATAFSVEPAASLWGAPGWRAGLLTWLASALVFLSAAGQLGDATRRRRLINVLLAVSAPICAYGLLQYLGFDPVAWSAEGAPRVFSTFGHPNFFAAYLAMVAPLTLQRVLAVRGRGGRLAWGALLAAQGLCMVLTLSRSGWLGMGTSVGLVALVMAWRAGRKRLAAGLVIGAGCAALTLLALSLSPALPGYASPLLQTVTSVFRWNSPTVQVRLLGWEAAGSMIADRPLLGFGPGTFGLALDRYYPPRLALFGGTRALGGHPHNLLLETAAEVGLPGALVYGWLVGAGLWGLWQRAREGSAEWLAMLAAAVGGLVTGVLEFETVSAAMLFWLLAGMAQASGARPIRVPRLAGAAMGAAGAVCALVIVAPDVAGGLAQRSTPAEAAGHAQWAYRASITPGNYAVELAHYCAAAALWPEGEAVLRELVTGVPAVAGEAAYWRALGDYYVRWAWSEPGGWHEAPATLGREAGFAQAAEAYGEALALSPTNPDLWLDRGMARLELGQHDAARADFVEAGGLAPDYARAVRALGEYYLTVGEQERARAAFARAEALRHTWELYLWQR